MPLRLLDLPGNAGDHDIALQTHARVPQRAHRLHVAGQGTFHVRDAETVDTAVLDETFRLEAADAGQPRFLARIRRVHVAVEHQRLAAAGAFPDSDDVWATFFYFLPLHLEPHLGELVPHPL